MVNTNDVQKIVSNNYNGSIVTYIADIGSKLVVSIKPKDWNEHPLDSFFTIDKTTRKMTEWNPLLDLEAWKNRKELYSR